jgi:hypothetical protein
MFGHDKKLKNFIDKVTNLSGPQAQDDLEAIAKKEKILVETIESQNKLLASFLKKVDEADRTIKDLGVMELMRNDESVDEFSRVKDIIGYFEVNGSEVKDLVDQALLVEHELQKKAEDLGYTETKHEYRLFTREEEKMLHIAKKVMDHAASFKSAVLLLQRNEREAGDPKEILERKEKDVYRALQVLRKSVNRLIVEFNHAIDTAEKLMKDDIIWKAILKDHMDLLKNGKYTKETKKNEEAELFQVAKDNAKDRLFQGDRELMRQFSKEYDEKLEKQHLKKVS